MDAGWRRGKAERPQASLGASEIVDANDEVIDEAGHGISGGRQARTVMRAATAAQSIVYDVELKKIYCKAAPYS
jgi:hypothetical protein